MITDRFLVTDRAAIVTGAGRGIGAATAVALAEAGADVLIAARTEADLQQVATRIEQAGRKAVTVPADLSDTEAVADLARTAYETFGRLDIVINNVGGAYPRPFLETDATTLEKAFRFNVSNTHALTRAAVPLMLESAHDAAGAIVNVSSIMGRVSGRGYLAYGTAKAALTHLTELTAYDLAPRIRVNGIAVGSVATSALDLVVNDENLKDQLERNTPLERIGEPEEAAAAAVFLASDAASYMTGKVMEVDGGLQRPNLELGLPNL